MTFDGPVAPLRARDYYDALRQGRISDQIKEAATEEPVNMTVPPKSEAVRGQITKWMGDIGVRLWLTPSTHMEGPIEADDWPIIERLEREDRLRVWSPEVARRFEQLRRDNPTPLTRAGR